MHVGIIGAGAAAAATTHVLDATVPDATVTVLEKSGGVCGRAATRRRGEVTYDYGANYVKDGSDRVADLLTNELDTDGLVDIAEPVWVFDAEGRVSPGRENQERKWTYRGGLTQIAKRLFGNTDAAVHRRTRIEHVERAEAADGSGVWHLTDTDGERWGPFDVLCCNPPAPQTAELLRGASWKSPVRETLVSAIEAVDYRTIWTAVLGYEFELDVPYYGLVNPGKDHDVGWISREECKPGHVPAGESVLIVQASHPWSVEHYDDPSMSNVEQLAAMTAAVMDDERLADPDWTDHQGWRYALAEGAVARGPLESARDHDLYCLGDWVAGEARVHAALQNGLETGEQLAYRL